MNMLKVRREPKSVGITSMPTLVMACTKHLANCTKPNLCTRFAHANCTLLRVASRIPISTRIGCQAYKFTHIMICFYTNLFYSSSCSSKSFWHIYCSCNCTLFLHNSCSHSWWLIHFADFQEQRWRWRILASCHNVLGILWPWPWGYLRCLVSQHSISRASWRKSFPGGAWTLRFKWSHKSNGLCRLLERV